MMADDIVGRTTVAPGEALLALHPCLDSRTFLAVTRGERKC